MRYTISNSSSGPTFDLGEGCQPCQPGLSLFRSGHGELGIGGNGVPPIGIAGGALQGAAALTPDPDGRMGVLHGFGEKIEIVKLTVLSLERRVLARPQFFEDLQIFVRNRPTLRKRWQTEGCKLFAHPAYADPNDNTALR